MLHWLLKLIHKIILFQYKILRKLWRIVTSIDILNEAIWLSLLSSQKHAKIIGQNYKRDSKYSNDDRTVMGFYPWEELLVNQFVKPSSVITLIGAGGGREAYALAKKGFTVNAWEVDKKMLSYASTFFAEIDLPISYSWHQANTIPTQKCDVFWFGWGLYTNIIERSTRVRLLQEAKENLNQEGLIIISYWPETRQSERINRIDTISKKINKRSIEKGETFHMGCWSKYFTPEQITEEVLQANLRVLYINNETYGHAILAK